jgi:hypothetical protein
MERNFRRPCLPPPEATRDRRMPPVGSSSNAIAGLDHAFEICNRATHSIPSDAPLLSYSECQASSGRATLHSHAADDGPSCRPAWVRGAVQKETGTEAGATERDGIRRVRIPCRTGAGQCRLTHGVTRT